MLLPPSTTDDDRPPIEAFSRGRKKPRRKRDREKWNTLYFIPKETLNLKNRSNNWGRKGTRIGLQLHRDLSCKYCLGSNVFHKRLGRRGHAHQFHKKSNLEENCITPLNKPNKMVPKNFAKKRKMSESGYFSDVEILSDEEDSNESLPKGLGKNDKPDESGKLNKSTTWNDMAKLQAFQPEVSLSLELTKSLKKHNLLLKSRSPPQRKSSLFQIKSPNVAQSEDGNFSILDDSMPLFSTPLSSHIEKKRKSALLSPISKVLPVMKKTKASMNLTYYECSDSENKKLSRLNDSQAKKSRLDRSFQTTMEKLKMSLSRRNALNNNNKGTENVRKDCDEKDIQSPQISSSPSVIDLDSPIRKNRLNILKPTSLIEKFDDSAKSDSEGVKSQANFKKGGKTAELAREVDLLRNQIKHKSKNVEDIPVQIIEDSDTPPDKQDAGVSNERKAKPYMKNVNQIKNLSLQQNKRGISSPKHKSTIFEKKDSSFHQARIVENIPVQIIEDSDTPPDKQVVGVSNSLVISRNNESKVKPNMKNGNQSKNLGLQQNKSGISSPMKKSTIFEKKDSSFHKARIEEGGKQLNEVNLFSTKKSVSSSDDANMLPLKKDSYCERRRSVSPEQVREEKLLKECSFSSNNSNSEVITLDEDNSSDVRINKVNHDGGNEKNEDEDEIISRLKYKLLSIGKEDKNDKDIDIIDCF